MQAEFALPDELSLGASARGNEYAWNPIAFRKVVANAAVLGYACRGGQFQFRVDGGTAEMYWIETPWQERLKGESWADFAGRSCQATLAEFDRLLSTTDFKAQAQQFESLVPLLASGWDPTQDLVFAAYFESQSGWKCGQEQNTKGGA